MSETVRVCGRVETRFRTRRLIEDEIAKQYPNLSRKFVKKIARRTASEVLVSYRGKRLALTTRPANKWQAFKERFAPKWFLAKFPVQYIES